MIDNNNQTKKQQRDFNLVSDTMTTTLTAGAKVLQDDFGMSDLDSGKWALKTAILINSHLGIDTTELAQMLDGLNGDKSA